MLQQVIRNVTGRNENKGSFSREIEDVKQNQMEILELKNTISNKNSAEGLKQNGGDARNNQWTIEITQPEQHGENRMKMKINRFSGTCETITRDPTIVSLESWKERRERQGLKKYSKKSCLKISQEAEQTPNGINPRKSTLWHTGVSYFSQVCFKPLCFYKRPMLVSVFTH